MERMWSREVPSKNIFTGLKGTRDVFVTLSISSYSGTQGEYTQSPTPENMWLLGLFLLSGTPRADLF